LLNTEINTNDSMWEKGGSIERYINVGKYAMSAIDHLAPHIQPSLILDLPCGHGRVARHLRHRWPDAIVNVADTDKEGVKFCVDVLGCTKVETRIEFDDLNLNQRFDLIWVGSLITHLPEENTCAFLRFIKRHLSETGSALITSHGTHVAGRIKQASINHSSAYGLEDEKIGPLFAQFIKNGYGYAPYYHSEDYGISVTSRRWWHNTAEQVGLKIEGYEDLLWDNHQDVIKFTL
jgi:SAM-dependent methyltransferase